MNNDSDNEHNPTPDVFSRLNRVVDISAIQSHRQKNTAQKHPPQKDKVKKKVARNKDADDKNYPKNRGIPQKISQQDSPNIAKQPKLHKSTPADKIKNFRPADSTQEAPAAQSSGTSTLPQQDAAQAQTRHLRLKTNQNPHNNQSVSESTPSSAPQVNAPNTRAVRSTSLPKLSGHAKFAARHIIGKKERPVLPHKPAKLVSRKKQIDSFSKKTTHTDNTADLICNALLLQSWRAKLWTSCITAISPTIDDNLQTAMPLVQAGLVNNVCIAPGRLEATIFDQVVSISLKTFTPGQWKNVVEQLSDRAIFATSLLNGELPEGILEIFKQASLSLFPTKIKEFSFTCDCNLSLSPCEHACALLITFAQCLEQDPFQILTLRGLTRDDLLSQLRDARSDQVLGENNKYFPYELPAQNVDFNNFFNTDANFDELTFHISYAPLSLIKRLNPPADWNAPLSVDDIIQPLIDEAAREAEQLALCEHYEIPKTDDIPPADMPPNGEIPSATASRAPKNKKNIQIPDMRFILTELSPDILSDIPDDPITAAQDVYRWLIERGPADVRTLARRTRLNKSTIEAILNALCIHQLTKIEDGNGKSKFLIY